MNTVFCKWLLQGKAPTALLPRLQKLMRAMPPLAKMVMTQPIATISHPRHEVVQMAGTAHARTLAFFMQTKHTVVQVSNAGWFPVLPRKQPTCAISHIWDLSTC
jgi:hypothetical protein